jgi:hypothetical protein
MNLASYIIMIGMIAMIAMIAISTLTHHDDFLMICGQTIEKTTVWKNAILGYPNPIPRKVYFPRCTYHFPVTSFCNLWNFVVFPSHASTQSEHLDALHFLELLGKRQE